jgi:hypothetical protein
MYMYNFEPYLSIDTDTMLVADESLRGIYLPVCREPADCHRRCVLLVHTTRAGSAGGHFSAVVGAPNIVSGTSSSGGSSSSGGGGGGDNVPEASLVPLCDKRGRLLPLRYAFFDDKEGLKLMNDEGKRAFLFKLVSNLKINFIITYMLIGQLLRRS